MTYEEYKSDLRPGFAIGKDAKDETHVHCVECAITKALTWLTFNQWANYEPQRWLSEAGAQKMYVISVEAEAKQMIRKGESEKAWSMHLNDPCQ